MLGVECSLNEEKVERGVFFFWGCLVFWVFWGSFIYNTKN